MKDEIFKFEDSSYYKQIKNMLLGSDSFKNKFIIRMEYVAGFDYNQDNLNLVKEVIQFEDINKMKELTSKFFDKSKYPVDLTVFKVVDNFNKKYAALILDDNELFHDPTLLEIIQLKDQDVNA